ncbi:MAG: SAM-dependent methyltransferase [Gammaproteobacteria bacterium]|jgi:SAM-dependent MidA family methyltransferase
MNGRHAFPEPSPEALATSRRLAALIRTEIDAAGGSIPFSRYMELCLYTPGLGYYSAGLGKFGPGGDFVTAPEISPLFGRCLARCCGAVLAEAGGGDMLEFGSGSGRLAVDVLGELERLNSLPEKYFILERSATLRQRQQELLRQQCPALFSRVAWLERLPDSGFRGILLANEVLDAMTVERFRCNGDTMELLHVGRQGEVFELRWQLVRDEALQGVLKALLDPAAAATGYVSEISLTLGPWLQSVAEVLEQGLLLLIDYGYPRHEYYHPQRRSGTLMCHYRHRAHDDVLRWPGLQDITAHVDFTAVAEAATAARLEVAGFTTQAHFLIDCGLERILQEAHPVDSLDRLKQAQQAKTLIMPGEMGERFKCIGLTRGIEQPLPGFRMQDLRNRL